MKLKKDVEKRFNEMVEKLSQYGATQIKKPFVYNEIKSNLTKEIKTAVQKERTRMAKKLEYHGYLHAKNILLDKDLDIDKSTTKDTKKRNVWD